MSDQPGDYVVGMETSDSLDGPACQSIFCARAEEVLNSAEQEHLVLQFDGLANWKEIELQVLLKGGRESELRI